MHAAGLHSALAIKRQRKRRDEQRRARERRFSSHSTESGLTSPRNSIGSLEGRPKRHPNRHGSAGDSKVVSSIGMLHIGVVFLVLGLFLLFSGLLPDDWSSWSSGKWWNELVATGAFSLGIGIFLIVLHFIISKQEDDELNEYVQGQLTRSRSGHRLERDVETGGLTTKHHRRVRQRQQEELERGLADFSPLEDELPSVHSPPPAYSATMATQHLDVNGHLAKILEEDGSEKGDEDARKIAIELAATKEAMSTSTTASLSPGSPSETQELLASNGGTRYVITAKV